MKLNHKLIKIGLIIGVVVLAGVVVFMNTVASTCVTRMETEDYLMEGTVHKFKTNTKSSNYVKFHSNGGRDSETFFQNMRDGEYFYLWGKDDAGEGYKVPLKEVNDYEKEAKKLVEEQRIKRLNQDEEVVSETKKCSWWWVGDSGVFEPPVGVSFRQVTTEELFSD